VIVTVVGDVHLADRPPSVRTETYAEDILTKLEWIVDYANQHSDVLLQLGDIYHVKQPHRTSHWLVQRTSEVFRAFKGRVLIVPGNHDLSQDRLESIPSQPIGTLALTPNVSLLDGFDDETGIYGIPYLDDQEEFLKRWDAAVTTGAYDTSLIATHAAIFPSTETPPYDHYSADDLPGTGGIPVAYGHIHDPHGFYYAPQGTWFCNNGAISRGSLHEETLKRKPRITLFDTETSPGHRGECPFTSVDVPHKPAAEVFRLVEVAEKKGQEQKLDEFLESVGEVSLTSLSMEEIVSHADSTELSAKAKAELKDIIESVL